MGNGQSAVEDRKHTRIAKPKGLPNRRLSGGNSPSLKADTPSPLSIGIPYSFYDGSESAIESPTKRDSRADQLLRPNFRSQLLSPQEHNVEEEMGEDRLDVMAVTVARSLSRSSSRPTYVPSLKSPVNKPKGNISQQSLTSERTVDLETAVAILHELRKTASPEDLVALHRALLPTRSMEPLSPTTDSIEEEVGRSAAGLIRRRSLARPGIATRHVKREPDTKVQSNEWDPDLTNSQFWKPEMMGTSPLARLSSLDNLEPDLLPPPTIGENRAHTPTGDEYSNLGSLKMGSLVVTNGLASPAPSFVSRDFTARRQSNSENEYYTASENGSTEGNHDKTLTSLPSSPHYSVNAKTTFHGDEEPQSPGQYERTMGLAAKRSGSPLKREIRAESPIWESERETESIISRKPRAMPSTLSLVARSENHSLFSNTSSEEDFKGQRNHQRTISQSAISLAHEYMSELPPSPYAIKPQSSRELPARPSAQSSISRLDVDTEHSNTSPPGLHQYQSWESSEIGQTLLNEEISPQTALRSNPPNSTMPLRSAIKNKRSSQAKTDSGYCSSVSTGMEGLQVVDMDQSILSPVASVVTSTPREKSPTAAADPRALPVSPTPSRPQTAMSEKWPAPFKMDETPVKVNQDEPELSKSEKKSKRRSLSRLLSSDSTPNKSPGATTPESKSSLKLSKSKRLQKRRPLSQPALTIGGSHSIDGEIPRVPVSVFTRFSERLTASPEMQHLNRTYEDPLVSDSRRGSASPGPISKTSPVVPASYFPDADSDSANSVKAKADRYSKKLDQAEAAPRPPAHRSGFSRLSFRRTSTQKNEEEEIAGVADFGTVAHSIGSGPYDIATSQQPKRPRSAAPGNTGNIQHPHQMGAGQPRYGPRAGWDAETASKFAQMRSRERAAATEAAEKGPSPGIRTRLADRPKSYHEQSPIRQPARPQSAVMQRPRSVHGDLAQLPSQQQYPVYDRAYPPTEYRVPNSASPATSRPRPRTANTEPVTYDQPPRSASPVKNLVSAFESRAANVSSPTPVPSSPQVDWSEQSRMWRERKLNAETTVRTTSSDYGDSITTTTYGDSSTMTYGDSFTTTSTTTTIISDPPHQPVTTTFVSPTITRTIGSDARYQPNFVSTPVSANRANRKSREQLHSAQRTATRSRHSTSPTPEPNPIPAQTQSSNLKSSGGDVFGRLDRGHWSQRERISGPFSSNGKRNVTPRTQKVKSRYGIDFGDVPTGPI